MDPQRFDSLAKRLGSRLSRRDMMRASAGAAVGAVALGKFGSVAAQDSGTTAKDRFIAVRTYAYTGTEADAASGLHGLIAVMEQQPGFIEYNLVFGDGQILAISTFLDENSAVAAAQQEDAWISANAANILSGTPTIQSGDVFLRSELHAGCGCITGTENACDSERLTCCATTSRMGGPGICLTTETTCPGTMPAEPTAAPAQPTATPQPCTGDGCACASGTQSPCDDGLVCCTSEGAPPGAPGLCRTEDECGCTSEGCHCNGGVDGACDDGLVCCQIDGSVPGGPGSCETEAECDPPCGGDGCACTSNDGCDDGYVCCGTAYPVCRAVDACGCSGAGCHCHMGMQGKCDDGFDCCYDDPSDPGPGTCEPAGTCPNPPCTSEGCACTAGTDGACDDGLVCCGASQPGGSGTCETEAECNPPCTSEGCDCTAGTDGACDDGLVCCGADTPGGTGTCETEAECNPPCTGEGCDCTAGTEGACDDGLECCGADTPGGTGTCETACG